MVGEEGPIARHSEEFDRKQGQEHGQADPRIAVKPAFAPTRVKGSHEAPQSPKGRTGGCGQDQCPLVWRKWEHAQWYLTDNGQRGLQPGLFPVQVIRCHGSGVGGVENFVEGEMGRRLATVAGRAQSDDFLFPGDAQKSHARRCEDSRNRQ